MDILEYLKSKDFLLALSGVVVGAVITWWVSYHYYVKSGEDLLKETARLRKFSNAVMMSLQTMQHQQGMHAEISADSEGDLTKVNLKITPQAASAKAEVGAPRVEVDENHN